MYGASKTRIFRAAALAALAALCLGIGAAHAAHPAANGLIAFVRGSSIYTIASDGTNLSPALVAGNHPAFSPDGTQIAYDDGTTLWTMTSTGGSQTQVPGPIAGTEPVWINANTLAFTGPGPNNQIEKVSVAGGTVTNLTSNTSTNQDPAASPDGTQIAFSSNQSGSFLIYTVSTGGGPVSGVSSGNATDVDPTWSPDGTQIAFVTGSPKQISTAGGALTSGSVDNTGPSYSPDGSSIVVSTPTGLATLPAGGGATTPVVGTAGGDAAPDWQDAAPVNHGLPTITPTTPPVAGGTLTRVQGTWTGGNSNTYTYQWERCDGGGANCGAISGATGTSYFAVAADTGSSVTIKVRETATNIAGSSTVESPPAGRLLANWPINFNVPSISTATPRAFPFGTTITGTTGTWTGVTPITYTFQWLWCDYAKPPQCEPIPGATSSSYAPSADYINHSLQLMVTAKNSAGSDTAYSVLSAWVTGDVPTNTISPRILAGSIEVGSTLTTDTGTFTGSTPFHYTYQWVKCQPVGQPCTPIPGATASAYVLQPSDQGATIRSQVTAKNGGGSDVGVSNHTLPILPKTRFGPANTNPPVLAGKPVVGSTLVADSGTWSGEAPINYTFTWLRCDATGQDCKAIPNAARTVYKLKLADAGYTIKLLVTGRNVLGAATVNSDPTDVITQLPKKPKGRKITGNNKNNYLAGGGGNDVINGLGGNDTIKGGGGDDVLNGGPGHDVIDGGPGADRINGGPGSDTILAADGERDVIDCGLGVDKATVDTFDVVKNCESVAEPNANLPRRGR
jgi:Ca2+-binding RTX toxin-like protein